MLPYWLPRIPIRCKSHLCAGFYSDQPKFEKQSDLWIIVPLVWYIFLSHIHVGVSDENEVKNVPSWYTYKTNRINEPVIYKKFTEAA